MENAIVRRLLLFVVGVSLFWGLAHVAAGMALFLGNCLFFIGLFLLFPSRKKQQLPSRISSVILIFIGASAVTVSEEQIEIRISEQLEIARAEGEDEYFAAVREHRGQQSWLETLQAEAPELYSETIEQIELEREAQRLEAAQEREADLVCDRVKRWLMEAGTRQYQSIAAPGVLVFSVSSGRCTARVGNNGYYDVNIEGIEVALRDRPNPRNFEADAIVRPDNPETDEFELAVCRIAWGPFDWSETTAGC